MLIEIHVYGHLKMKFDPTARLSDQTIIRVPSIPGEQFVQLLARINLSVRECGDCFVNGMIATLDTPVPEGARVALFPLGMHLLDGGQHLKGHGYVIKTPPREIDYY